MQTLESVGCCRSCGGVLDIMTDRLPRVVVVCTECSDTYVIGDEGEDAQAESPAKEVTP